MFADDTTLLASSDYLNIEELKNTLSRKVANVDEWATNNKLPLNCSKMKTILINGPRLRNEVSNEVSNEDRKIEIELKGSTLEQVENVKLLGLELDEQLSFDVHIDSLCKKISKRIGILNRIKAYLPRAERILYYNSLIKPLVLYCSVIWTSCCSHDNINKIFKLQKCCARIILDAQQRHSTLDLFNILGWVPYNIESDIKRCLIAYKRIMGTCPAYMNELLELNNSQHSRNTRC